VSVNGRNVPKVLTTVASASTSSDAATKFNITKSKILLLWMGQNPRNEILLDVRPDDSVVYSQS
jgi:hypothetical protein